MRGSSPVLSASKRERLGTRYSQRERELGRLPIVVYAKGAEPLSLSVDARETKRHINKGEKIYRMDLDYTRDQLMTACCELVEKNRLESCYIRPMVLRGYGAASMVPFASPIEVFIPCWPWGAYLG
ncbi:MAG: hypothetical protein JNL44_18210, partial [Gemmatimonadetes bacterium]|nr:hypothetical protein [Gemmatimonadota bacterium]